MDEDGAWQALVDELYLFATAGSAEDRVPAALARLTGGAHAVLWTVDPLTGAPAAPIRSTFPDEAVRLYGAHYHRTDPWMARSHLMGWDRITPGSDLLPDEELARTAFYNDYARHMDAFHVIGARLAISADPGDPYGVFATFRPQGQAPFTGKEQARLRRLVPHVRRAWQIGQQFGPSGPIAAVAWEAGAAAVLQGFQVAALVTDGFGRVLLANAAAEALERAGGLRLRGAAPARVLELDGPGATRWLHGALADAARGGAGGERILSIGEAGPCRLTVSPLPRRMGPGMAQGMGPGMGPGMGQGGGPGGGPGGGAGAGHALVVIKRQSIGPDEAMILRARRLFGLSRGEAEVALMLVEGLSPAEIAQARQVRISTVRTQLQRALEKAGAGDIRGLAVRMTLLRR